MDLYCPKRLLTISNIGELRWYMLSKFQYESEKLPLTKVHFTRKYSDHTVVVSYRNQLIYNHPFYLILKSLAGAGTHLKSPTSQS